MVQKEGEGNVSTQVCGSCGADMVFDPKSGMLACPYCGSKQEVRSSKDTVVEQDLLSFLKPDPDRLRPISKEALQVTCDSCGATVTFVPPETATSCEFCAAKIVAQPKSADPLVAPEGVIPFSVENKKAASALSKWTKTRWFAPNKLKTMARQDRATSIYIPYWTFDADSYTDYTGQRGDTYYVTESYTDSQGNRQTRQVPKIRWSFASGSVSRHFDDVTVPATTSVLPKYLNRLNWDFTALTSYEPAYLAGHKAQTYQVTLESGFETFKNIADGVIRGDVANDIGGDRQQISTMDTRFSDLSFKHILVPVYAGAYRFNNKVYQVIINGTTGEVYGERPYSVLKIGCLVLVILFFLAVFLIIFSVLKT